jgi:hypothetical protein
MNEVKSRRLAWLLNLHALLSIGLGIAFALYAPLMMAFFAVPELLDADAQAYWSLASFARMFGAALFGFGLLIFSVRAALPQLATETRRGVLFALLLASLMGAIVSITQQSAVWGTPAGWIATGSFVLLSAAYGYFLAG